MAQPPRILVLNNTSPAVRDLLLHLTDTCESVTVENWEEALKLLRLEPFDAVCASGHTLLHWADSFGQAARVLDALADGVALLDLQRRILWANHTFEAWSGGPARGRDFATALGSAEGAEPDPFAAVRAGGAFTARLHAPSNRTFEVHLSPLRDAQGRVIRLVALCHDVSAEALHLARLEALHQAGRELAALPAEQLGEMSVEERIELFKRNIRRFTHDLLHYDVIEVRMLDRRTNRLEPLLQEGMTPEAAQRPLLACPTENGVTGRVAATGKSYLCPDTSTDPLYLPGAPAARSSLTVPLIYQEEVIGTFNIESPLLNVFGESDVQFVEMFSREMAAALHTLELLTAEKRGTTTYALGAVSREVALPVDDILAAAASALERYVGLEPELAEQLRLVQRRARSIKQCIQKVGETLTPAEDDPAEDQRTARLKGLRVLVADNDEHVRRSAHGILGGWGCVVETARDGREALSMARQGSYDAILSDIRLPDISGYEAYRRLREAQPQARVILMTAYGYDPSHSLVKARQDGLRHVLFKPFRIDQLRDVLAGADSTSEPRP